MRIYLDVLERVGWTFIQAFAATVIVTGFNKEGLVIAASAAGVSALKCVAATRIGDSDSAAALPGDH